MNKHVLNIILMCHAIFILFALITPFYGSDYFLLLHAIIMPFIMFHWAINNNTCGLTILERYIREKMNDGKPVDNDDCFTCRLIEPIYDVKIKNEDLAGPLYVITTILWLISVYKLYTKYKSQGFVAITNILFNRK